MVALILLLVFAGLVVFVATYFNRRGKNDPVDVVITENSECCGAHEVCDRENLQIIDTKIIKIDENSYLDLQNLEINLNKKSFIISKKESEILAYLLNNQKKTISIEEIINNIWSYEDSVESSTIRTYIKNLRKILGEDKILNIRGVGYRFNF